MLLYYEKTGKAFVGCDAAGKSIAKYLNDYSKDQQYFRKKNPYMILRPLLERHAIPNARFLEKDRGNKALVYPRAEEVYKFIEKYIVQSER